MDNDLLLEIGTEEIPARFIPAAIQIIRDCAEGLFKENRIHVEDVIVYATPRRLTLIVKDLSDFQENITTKVFGPPKGVAYDNQGNPTRAAMGFAKGQGVDVSLLKIESTDKGEYAYVEKHEKGKKTMDILSSLLEELLVSVNFPKSMRWNDTRVRFARPVRWILAFFGKESLNIRFAGLQSGKVTYGHHFMKPASITVKGVDDYLQQLENNFVIIDQTRRQKLIEEQIIEISIEKGGRVITDKELLEEITFLVEYPLAICGRFDETYLTIPKDVLITVMKEHQRCFSLEDEKGNLLPYFIAISNTIPKNIDVVRNGYERVISARLSDARFFFDEDCKKRLETHTEKLKQVVFMGRLGTMWDKVQRLIKLSGQLTLLLVGPQISPPQISLPKISPVVQKAASLSKADLMTEMVGEFPELQGIMGREYAIRQGEVDDVARAIFEHYLPRFSGDILPSSQAGKVLAIADKIDNIVGCFGIGNIPSGSFDPYALRRQALGILNILITGKHLVSLKEIIKKAISVYGDMIEEGRYKEILYGILEFFMERFNTLLVTEGYRYDCVRAALSAGLDDPFDAFLRICALDRFRQGPEFESLIISFKRVMNIIPPDFIGELKEEFFKENAERKLYEAFRGIRDKVLQEKDRRDYEKAFALISELKPQIDLFFDMVLVMDKDMVLRNNRLSLLNELKGLFLTLADFTQIVVEG